MATSRSSFQHAALVMEGLTESYEENGKLKVRPLLSENWETPTPTRFVFHLRTNVLWSDGKALTANDFLFAWKRLLTHAAETPYASLLFPIQNAKAFADGKKHFDRVGLSAPNASTLQIDLEHKDPRFLLWLSHPATFPGRADHTPPTLRSPILGPFFLEKSIPGTLWAYRKNPLYQGRPVALDSLEWQVFRSEEARVQLFLNGETDLADFLPQEAATLTGSPSSSLSIPTRQWVGLLFNTAKRPFQNASARRAFQQSIQREEPSALLKSPDLPAFAMSSLWGATPETTAPSWLLKYSPVSARANLENGAETRKDNTGAIKPIPKSAPSLLLGYGDFPNAEAVAEDLQAQWLKQLDLKVEVTPFDASLLPALALITLSLNPYLPGAGLDYFLTASAKTMTHWHSTDFETSLAQAAESEDLSKFSEELAHAEEIVFAQDAAAMPLYFEGRRVLRRPEVQNLDETSIEIWNFRDTTIR